MGLGWSIGGHGHGAFIPNDYRNTDNVPDYLKTNFISPDCSVYCLHDRRLPGWGGHLNVSKHLCNLLAPFLALQSLDVAPEGFHVTMAKLFADIL